MKVHLYVVRSNIGEKVTRKLFLLFSHQTLRILVRIILIIKRDILQTYSYFVSTYNGQAAIDQFLLFVHREVMEFLARPHKECIAALAQCRVVSRYTKT